jgi:hypothetical protein
MAIADGRHPTSLTMMIRAGSKNSRLNHAIAQVRERNRTNHLYQPCFVPQILRREIEC